MGYHGNGTDEFDDCCSWESVRVGEGRGVCGGGGSQGPFWPSRDGTDPVLVGSGCIHQHRQPRPGKGEGGGILAGAQSSRTPLRPCSLAKPWASETLLETDLPPSSPEEPSSTGSALSTSPMEVRLAPQGLLWIS